MQIVCPDLDLKCVGSQNTLSDDANLLYDEQVTYFPIDYNKDAQETALDPILCKIMNYVLPGWPVYSSDKRMHPYFNHKEALTVHQGVLLLQNTCVVIPDSLKDDVLTLFHWEVVQMRQLDVTVASHG